MLWLRASDVVAEQQHQMLLLRASDAVVESWRSPDVATEAEMVELCCDKCATPCCNEGADERVDRCDGPHLTEACQVFKKARTSHPDALRRRLTKAPAPHCGSHLLSCTAFCIILPRHSMIALSQHR